MVKAARKTKSKKINYFKALFKIANKVNSTLAPDQVLNAIVESTAKSIGAKGCSLMLLTSDRKQLIHTTAYGLSGWYLRKGPVRADIAITEALQGKPVIIRDVATDPRVQYREQAVKEGIASMLSIPLRLRDETIGIMRLYTADSWQFSPEEIIFLEAVANLGTLALDKAKTHDALQKDYEYCLLDLEETKKELQKLEESKNQLMRFLSIAAHDLKSPLAAVQSYFNVLLGGFVGGLNEKQKQMIGRSDQRIKGLLELVNDLLDISRIETGQIIKEMKEVSLSEILKTPLEDARAIAEPKKITLVLDVPEDLPKVYASPQRLGQVFVNLLNNAVKFTPEKGTISIKIKHQNNEIESQIADTGIGIPAQDLPRLFEEFFRASNVETPGTGLGLAIVKRIIEAHGGRIWAESPCPETGLGSKFTFVLPIRQIEIKEGGGGNESRN